MGLGDAVEKALAIAGVTSEEVEKWVGGPCGCAERRDKLNALGFWVARVVSGKIEKARAYLDVMMGRR